MKKIISFLMLSIMIISLSSNAVYAQNIKKTTLPTDQQIRDFLKDYYNNKHTNKNKVTYDTQKNIKTSDQKILSLQSFLRNSVSTNVSNVSKTTLRSSLPKELPEQLDESLFTGKKEFANHGYVGDNYAYVADRIGYAGGTSTMITSIAFLGKSLTLTSEDLIDADNPKGTVVTATIEYSDSYVVAYDTYSGNYKVLVGDRPINTPEIGIGTKDSIDLVYYLKGFIVGSSSGSGLNITKAVLAGCPVTSGGYYAITELFNNAFDSYDLPGDKYQYKSFPTTLRAQQSSITLDKPIRAVGFKFLSRSFTKPGHYATVVVKFNNELTESDIEMTIGDSTNIILH